MALMLFTLLFSRFYADEFAIIYCHARGRRYALRRCCRLFFFAAAFSIDYFFMITDFDAV